MTDRCPSRLARADFKKISAAHNKLFFGENETTMTIIFLPSISESSFIFLRMSSTI